MHNIITFINSMKNIYQEQIKKQEYIRIKSLNLFNNEEYKRLIIEYQNRPAIISEIIKYQYNSVNFDSTYFTHRLKIKNYETYIKKKINLYEKLINNSIKFNKDIMVYRGEYREKLNLKKNDIYEPGTFMATSLNPGHSYSFYPGNLISLTDKKKGCCFYKIIIPKNTPIFYLIYKKLYNKMEENEILLNYNNKYLVLDKYIKYNITFYVLQIINTNTKVNLQKILQYDISLFKNIYNYFKLNDIVINKYNKLHSINNNIIFDQLYFFNNYDGKSKITIDKYKLDKLKEYNYKYSIDKYIPSQIEYIKHLIIIDSKYIYKLKYIYNNFNKILQHLENKISIYQVYYGDQKINNKRYLLYLNYIITNQIYNKILNNDIITINNYFIGTFSLLGLLGIPEISYIYKKDNYNTTVPDFLMKPTKNKLDNLIPNTIIKYNIKKNTKYIAMKNFVVLNEMNILIDKNIKFKKKQITYITDLNNNKIKIIELDQI